MLDLYLAFSNAISRSTAVKIAILTMSFALKYTNQGWKWDGMPYQNFTGWVEIIPSLPSREVSYRYASGLSTSQKSQYCLNHEIWHIDSQENH